MTHEPTQSQLRRFGLAVGAGLAVLGLISWYRGHTDVPTVLWTIAGLLLLLGLLLPNLLLPVWRAWMALAMALGWINTRLILSVLFYGIFTPLGMIIRLFRDPLDRQLQKGRDSYWVRKKTHPLDQKAYERQF